MKRPNAIEIDNHVETIQQAFADEVKRLRQTRNLSVDGVVDLLSVGGMKGQEISGKTIQNIESYRHNPKLKDILRLIYHLGGDPVAMLTGLPTQANDEEEKEAIRRELNLHNYDQARQMLETYKQKYAGSENKQHRQFILWIEATLSSVDEQLANVPEERLVRALLQTLPKIVDRKGRLDLLRLGKTMLTLQEHRIVSAIARIRGGEKAVVLYQLMYTMTETSITLSVEKRNEQLISLQYNISIVLLRLNKKDPRILRVCEKALELSLSLKSYDLLGKVYFNMGRFYYYQENRAIAEKNFNVLMIHLLSCR